jgi:hypothetical protein
VCSGVDERARRGAGGGRRAVLRPFYGCGGRAVTRTGKWGVARGTTRRGRGAWFRPTGGFLTDSGPTAARMGGTSVAQTGEREGLLTRGP